MSNLKKEKPMMYKKKLLFVFLLSLLLCACSNGSARHIDLNDSAEAEIEELHSVKQIVVSDVTAGRIIPEWYSILTQYFILLEEDHKAPNADFLSDEIKRNWDDLRFSKKTSTYKRFVVESVIYQDVSEILLFVRQSFPTVSGRVISIGCEGLPRINGDHLVQNGSAVRYLSERYDGIRNPVSEKKKNMVESTLVKTDAISRFFQTGFDDQTLVKEFLSKTEITVTDDLESGELIRRLDGANGLSGIDLTKEYLAVRIYVTDIESMKDLSFASFFQETENGAEAYLIAELNGDSFKLFGLRNVLPVTVDFDEKNE